MYIDIEYVKPNSVEFREYQINIAESAEKEHTLVVLPTGLGKTIIALLLIAKQLKKNDKKILFLAPTKPLVIQHARFLSDLLTLPSESVTVFTGEISPEKRTKNWAKSQIIVSTPQVIENDLLNRRIDLHDVSLLIFDEAHHATGKYAYVYIAEVFTTQATDGRILGITASPGNELEKILEICKNLSIDHIEIRTKHDKDVKPYVHELSIEWMKVDVPESFSYAVALAKKALKSRLQFLKNLNTIESSSVTSINKKKLIDAQKIIQTEIRSRTKPPKALFQAASKQSEALKLLYGIELLETQGVESVKRYFSRIRTEAGTKSGSKSSKNLLKDTIVLEFLSYLNSLVDEHPKRQTVADIVEEELEKNPDARIIVFTHFRDTSIMVLEKLKEIDTARPVRFIGQNVKTDDKGLSQKQQTEIIKKFRNGEYNVLVATSVAEEGLDIPSTDLVVFYEPIPSEIRTIQRRGRTARKQAGKMIILITKGTADEGYFWAAKRREKSMRSELELLRSKLDKEFSKASVIHSQQIKENQTTLQQYDSQVDKVRITVDHREYRSTVVRSLLKKGVIVQAEQLPVADYIVSSRIGIERKQVDDFLNSLMKGTLFSQLKKLRDAYARPFLIIEGIGLFTKRNINHHAIYGTFVSIIVDFGISIITTEDPGDTADLLFITAKREQKKKNKDIVLRGGKDRKTTNETLQFILEGFPYVSSVIAKRLLEHFGSIHALVNASEDELQEVHGVGKTIAGSLHHIINSEFTHQ